MFLLDVTCMEGVVFNEKIPQIVSLLINLIKVSVPVLLIIFGMLDLGKAVVAQKEDEIKKGQQTFVKRLIAAAIVFFVFVIVQVVFNLVSDEGDADIWSCVNCLINNECAS